MASLSEKSDPLASARARIRERLTDDVIWKLRLHAGDPTFNMETRQAAMRDVLADAIAPLLVETERRDVDQLTLIAMAQNATARAEAAEARVEALQRDLERIKELARKEHELLASIVRRLQEIGELADVPNANITGAIHGLIEGYVSYRHDYKYEKQRADALAAELLEVKSTWQGWGNERSAFLADVAAKIETHKSNAKTWREAIEERLNLLIEKAAERDALAAELAALKGSGLVCIDPLHNADSVGAGPAGEEPHQCGLPPARRPL